MACGSEIDKIELKAQLAAFAVSTQTLEIISRKYYLNNDCE